MISVIDCFGRGAEGWGPVIGGWEGLKCEICKLQRLVVKGGGFDVSNGVESVCLVRIS